MQQDIPYQLELALFRVTDEENQMRIHLKRNNLVEKSREYAEVRDCESARLYHRFTTSPNYFFDYFMFDDE